MQRVHRVPPYGADPLHWLDAALAAAGLPQPPGTILETAGQAAACDRFPVFLKLPIGTATSGVALITGPAGRDRFVAAAEATGAFTLGGLLAQRPVDGPLIMTQSVFDRGELVAWHACLRVREGTSVGASHKRSASPPAIREHLARLGRQLGWHGALSADAILGDAGPCYIDINPRLVEPGNAWRAGVDLVAPMLDLAGGRHRRSSRAAARASAPISC